MRHPLFCYFGLTDGIWWLIWAPLWLPALGLHGLPVLPYHHVLGAVGPIAAASIVSAIERGRAGPLDLLRTMALWRGRVAWVLIALLGPYALLVLGLLVAALFEGHAPVLANLGRSAEFPQFSGWLFSLLTGAILLTWFYTQSRGSLLVVALFHAGSMWRLRRLLHRPSPPTPWTRSSRCGVSPSF